MDIEKKMDELGRAHEEFKAAHSKELNEIKERGAAFAETSEKVGRINDAIDKIEGELKSLKAAQNRTGNGGAGNNAPASEYKQAFEKFLRKGIDVPSDVVARELKEMSVQIDEDGGFLVTPEVSSEIVSKVYESSPMRQLASVITISTDSFDILQDLDEVESGWVGEKQARPETETPKLKMIKIPVHELYAQPSATQKILDDASVNVESWLASKASEKFIRDEASAFVNGDGVGKPKGILSYGSGVGFNLIERIQTAAANTLAADDILEMEYAIKGAYKANASWGIKRSVIKTIRKFKGTDGQYLWQPGLNGRGQSTLAGFPIYEFDDLESLNGTDQGKQPIIFGDFRQGYQIVDRTGIRVLRDPYTRKPFVLFYFTKRVGGGVKNFEALKVLKIKA